MATSGKSVQEVALDSMVKELEDLAFNKYIPSMKIAVKECQQIQKEVIELEEQMNEYQSEMFNCLVNFFDLSPEERDHAFAIVRQRIEKEQQELDTLKQELEDVKQEKAKAKKSLTEGEAQFDSLQNQLKELDTQLKKACESRRQDSTRAMSEMMQTKFDLDPKGRCISLILNNNKRVERVTRVDKENTPENELRDSIWNKFYSLYSVFN